MVVPGVEYANPNIKIELNASGPLKNIACSSLEDGTLGGIQADDIVLLHAYLIFNDIINEIDLLGFDKEFAPLPNDIVEKMTKDWEEGKSLIEKKHKDNPLAQKAFQTIDDIIKEMDQVAFEAEFTALPKDVVEKMTKDWENAKDEILKEDALGSLNSRYLSGKTLQLLRAIRERSTSTEEAIRTLLALKELGSDLKTLCAPPQPQITSIAPTLLYADPAPQTITINGENLKGAQRLNLIAVENTLSGTKPRIISFALIDSGQIKEEGKQITALLTVVLDGKPADSYLLSLFAHRGGVMAEYPVTITQKEPESKLPPWAFKLGPNTVLDLKGESKAVLQGGYAGTVSGDVPEDNRGEQGNTEDAATNVQLKWAPAVLFEGDNVTFKIIPQGQFGHVFFPDRPGGKDQATHRLNYGGGLTLATDPIEKLLRLAFRAQVVYDHRDYSEQHPSINRPNEFEDVIDVQAELPFSPGWDPLLIKPIYGFQKGFFDYNVAVLSEDFSGERKMHEYGLGLDLELPRAKPQDQPKVKPKVAADAEFTLARGEQEEPDSLAEGGKGIRSVKGHHSGLRFALPRKGFSAQGTWNHLENGLRNIDHWIATLRLDTKEAGNFWIDFGQTDGYLINPFNTNKHHKRLLEYEYAYRNDGSRIPIFTFATWELPWVPGLEITPHYKQVELENNSRLHDVGGLLNWNVLKTLMPEEEK